MEKIGNPDAQTQLIDSVGIIVRNVQLFHSELTGIIIFGSRTQNGYARPTSDIDMIIVQNEIGHGGLVLKCKLQELLSCQGIKLDLYCLFTSFVRKAVQNPEGREARELSKSALRFLDQNSVFLLSDEATKELIKTFTRCDQKKWTRKT